MSDQTELLLVKTSNFPEFTGQMSDDRLLFAALRRESYKLLHLVLILSWVDSVI